MSPAVEQMLPSAVVDSAHVAGRQAVRGPPGPVVVERDVRRREPPPVGVRDPSQRGVHPERREELPLEHLRDRQPPHGLEHQSQRLVPGVGVVEQLARRRRRLESRSARISYSPSVVQSVPLMMPAECVIRCHRRMGSYADRTSNHGRCARTGSSIVSRPCSWRRSAAIDANALLTDPIWSRSSSASGVRANASR